MVAQIQNLKLQTQPRAAPISDISISRVASEKTFVSAGLAPDIDPVQGIARFFNEPSNLDPHTSRLQNQTRLITPLSCDIKTDITKPTSQKTFVLADLAPDLDHLHAIARVFSEPSNHDPHTSRLLPQTLFFTPLICDV